jgi:hypothetical protein
MRSARKVIVSRGPWPAAGKSDAIEVLFDDGSENPYALHFGTEQVDRLLADAGREARCTVWTAGPCLRLALPAYYRRVARLPCLQGWA